MRTLLLLFAALLASCTTGTGAGRPTPPASGRYALVVTFYSPGNGIDLAALDRLERIVRETTPTPARVTRRWGLEGERDECFTLEELDAPQRQAFIARVERDVVGGSERAQLHLDAPCRGGPR